ncbi:AMP-binding protein [uncultured Paraglaciecola sp.]|uniref:AMP-binding protein n=1 Tax=uncultured Paraglaciecola sp. TaxID=1765024 RepID=UPI002609D7C3|nr:AMP-binding protein [uncultured Paraglaciecola sp.]
MNKPWVAHYAPGVEPEIDAAKYNSVVEIFDTYTDMYAGNKAYISMHTSVTYQELRAKSEDFAAYLQHQMGLKKGDKFAIMLPNILQYPIALFGALKAGLTVVNVNPLYTPRELKHQLTDSGAKAILVIENFAHVLEAIVDETPIEHIITTQMGDCIGLLKGTMLNTVVKRVKKLVPAFTLPDTVKFNQTLRLGKKQRLSPVAITSSDLAFLQYTGGTTGVAKGGMLSHGNIVANMLQIKGMMGSNIVENDEMVVTALPLYHIYALTVNCLSFMTIGGCNLLISNPRDIPMFAKVLSKYPVTLFAGVNTLFSGLLNNPTFHNIDFSTWKVSIGGGMATQRAVAERWQRLTGTPILEGYGLTECSPCVTSSPMNQIGFTGSIGLPLCNTDVKIMDDQGNEVAPNQSGELWVKGPQVMEGYYNRPEATAEIMHDGWLATGDIARIDERGFVFIVDRKKDMIIVSGFNVFPNEIEDVIAMIDDVVEVAAIGVPCEKTGEKIKVFLVTKSGEINEETLVAHCRENLTAYKVPHEFELRTELPKSNVGKILRKELRN